MHPCLAHVRAYLCRRARPAAGGPYHYQHGRRAARHPRSASTGCATFPTTRTPPRPARRPLRCGVTGEAPGPDALALALCGGPDRQAGAAQAGGGAGCRALDHVAMPVPLFRFGPGVRGRQSGRPGQSFCGRRQSGTGGAAAAGAHLAGGGGKKAGRGEAAGLPLLKRVRVRARGSNIWTSMLVLPWRRLVFVCCFS